MLIELFGKNFGCFRDEFSLSLLAADIDRDSDRGIVEVKLENDDEPLRLLRCAAIYGPNASGKSTVLRAAGALQYVLAMSGSWASDSEIGPYEPFLLDPRASEGPVELGIRAVINRRVYQYEIRFRQAAFEYERLAHLGPHSETVLLEREEDKVSGKWAQDPQFGLVTQGFRANALLLSLADTFAPHLAGGMAVSLRQHLLHLDPSGSWWHLGAARAAQQAHNDRIFSEWLSPWLRAADVGVSSFDILEDDNVPDRPFPHTSPEPSTKGELAYRFMLSHDAAQGTVPFDFRLESLGTQKLIAIAPAIYRLTHSPKPCAYFVDEIGASVHPQLFRSLLQHHNCDTSIDAIRGQLVFATHETHLIDGEAKWCVLRRDQVYFTEKGSDGAARLYSLVEFKERNNLNLRKRYLQGRYGAIPMTGDFGD